MFAPPSQMSAMVLPKANCHSVPGRKVVFAKRTYVFPHIVFALPFPRNPQKQTSVPFSFLFYLCCHSLFIVCKFFFSPVDSGPFLPNSADSHNRNFQNRILTSTTVSFIVPPHLPRCSSCSYLLQFFILSGLSLDDPLIRCGFYDPMFLNCPFLPFFSSQGFVCLGSVGLPSQCLPMNLLLSPLFFFWLLHISDPQGLLMYLPGLPEDLYLFSQDSVLE